MDIKELLAKCEDVESKISEDDEDDELGLYIINTRRMYDKYCQPAMEKIRAGKGDEIDWRKIAIEGARMYAREIEPLHLDGDGYKATAEYLKDYYTNLAGDPIDEGMEEKPAEMETAEYKDMKIEKPEVEKAPKLNEEVAEKLNFKLGDADVEVTNDTKTEFTADEIREVIEKENPRIFFNDADSYHYIMDFSFEKDGKKYWIESKNIEGDFSKFELNIYEGFNESVAGSLVKELTLLESKEVRTMIEGSEEKPAKMEKAEYDEVKPIKHEVDENGKNAEKELKEGVEDKTFYSKEEIAKKLRSFIEDDETLYDVEDFESGVDIFMNVTDINWTKEMYDEFYGWLADYSIKGNGYEIYFSFDGSGYEYRIEGEGTPSHVSMVIETNGLTNEQLNKLYDDIEKADIDYYRKETYYWQQGKDLEKPLEESRADKIRKGAYKRVKHESLTKDEYQVIVRNVYGENAIIKNASNLANAKEIRDDLKSKLKSSPIYIIKDGKIIDEALNGDIVTVVDIPLVTEKLYNKLVNILYGNKQGKNRDYEQQQNVLNFLQEIEDKIPLESGISIDLEDYGFTTDEINTIKKIVREERVDESLNEEGAGDFKYQIGDMIKMTRKAQAEGRRLFGADFKTIKGEVINRFNGGIDMPNVYTVKMADGSEETVAETLVEYWGTKRKKEPVGESVKNPIESIHTGRNIYIKLNPEFENISLSELFKIIELGGTEETNSFWRTVIREKRGHITIKRNENESNELIFYPNTWKDKNFKIKTVAGVPFEDTFHAYGFAKNESFERNMDENMNEVSIETMKSSLHKQAKKGTELYQKLDDSWSEWFDKFRINRSRYKKIWKDVLNTKTDSEKEQFMKEYRKNENGNYHFENLLLTAEFVEDKELIKAAKSLLNKYRKRGNYSSDDEIGKAKMELGYILDPIFDAVYKDLKAKDESINEVSLETAVDSNDKRQYNSLKAELKAKVSGEEADEKEAEKLADKATKSNELLKRWKKAKGIEESAQVVVAKFDDGLHEIVKCDKGYFNRYNIKDGKARFTTKCVESLPTAVGALKRRFPNASEDINVNESLNEEFKNFKGYKFRGIVNSKTGEIIYSKLSPKGRVLQADIKMNINDKEDFNNKEIIQAAKEAITKE